MFRKPLQIIHGSNIYDPLSSLGTLWGPKSKYFLSKSDDFCVDLCKSYMGVTFALAYLVLIDCLINCLIDLLIHLLIDCLIALLIDLLIDLLIVCLIDLFIDF